MVLSFPTKVLSIERKAQPLVMPPPREPLGENGDESDSPWIAVDSGFAAQCADMYEGIRLVLLALLTFFGGRTPTRGDDPPGGVARPWKIELLDAIAGRRQSRRIVEHRPAANKEFPYAAAA
jgi:hypothetical protein